MFRHITAWLSTRHAREMADAARHREILCVRIERLTSDLTREIVRSTGLGRQLVQRDVDVSALECQIDTILAGNERLVLKIADLEARGKTQARATLERIVASRTPGANGTTRRIVRMAEEGLGV